MRVGLGLGAGAHSHMFGWRFADAASPSRYIAQVGDGQTGRADGESDVFQLASLIVTLV